ncbi:small integral membrane protein 24 isoform X1 [Tyto alba]|uniref:small integral membrane protein 24 isoform X1 n=1 Tax=Tyto alba TaxID=56313 RepID=UPI001C66DE2D|nr:small integral membrane protein 24 isoform X1 [Tyto alba]
MPRASQPLSLLVLLVLAATARGQAGIGSKQLQPWLIGLTAVVIFLFIVFVLLLINRLWQIRMRRWAGAVGMHPAPPPWCRGSSPGGAAGSGRAGGWEQGAAGWGRGPPPGTAQPLSPLAGSRVTSRRPRGLAGWSALAAPPRRPQRTATRSGARPRPSEAVPPLPGPRGARPRGPPLGAPRPRPRPRGGCPRRVLRGGRCRRGPGLPPRPGVDRPPAGVDRRAATRAGPAPLPAPPPPSCGPSGGSHPWGGGAGSCTPLKVPNLLQHRASGVTVPGMGLSRGPRGAPCPQDGARGAAPLPARVLGAGAPLGAAGAPLGAAGATAGS